MCFVAGISLYSYTSVPLQNVRKAETPLFGRYKGFMTWMLTSD